ncbi:hypothetical protein CKM354_001003000 [Cercospora kikuchii]|uniref:HMG box domain-containing protein n=1 Tax=Cercospora kikuchii TaxID=84275 RepID=A0A9P3CUJ5_9PEZI|nr:uncharacterized protein CKM354_001003000 [Cercospora kikuchii]GIZ46925.1 hypothetical protein CKM354_001003000 [Cercospora kikuchii]
MSGQNYGHNGDWDVNKFFDFNNMDFDGSNDYHGDQQYEQSDNAPIDPSLLTGMLPTSSPAPPRTPTPAPRPIPTPAPQQDQPAAPSLPTIPSSTTFSYREDIGWFMKVDFPTYLAAKDADGTIFNYVPVPPPESWQAQRTPAPQPVLQQQTYQPQPYQQQPYQQQPYLQQTYQQQNGTAFPAAFPNANLNANGQYAMPDFDPSALAGPYVAQTPKKKRSRPTAATPSRSRVTKNKRRPAFHRTSIIRACTCTRDHIPRPPNGYIIFRSRGIYSDEVMSYMTPEERIIISGGKKLDVKKVGRVWHSLPTELQQPYYQEARLAAAQHAAQYPGYKYQPQDDLKRDFGSPSCVCGAYQTNLAARNARAAAGVQDDEESTDDEIVVAKPPKKRSKSRKAQKQPLYDEPVTYAPPIGFAPMTMLNQQREEAIASWNAMPGAPLMGHPSQAANVSQRLTRGAKRTINYAENDDDADIELLLSGRLESRAAGLAFDDFGGGYEQDTLFVQDGPSQFESAPAYAPPTRRASRASFHQDGPSQFASESTYTAPTRRASRALFAQDDDNQFASASTYAAPARRASRLSFAQDNSGQFEPAPTYAIPARRSSRPLSRESQSQPLRSPYRPVSNLALPGGRPITSSRPPAERRDTLRSIQQIPPSRRRSSSQRHRQSVHSSPQVLRSPKRSPARKRQSDGFDSLFDDINEVEEEFDDDDGDSLFKGDF